MVKIINKDFFKFKLNKSLPPHSITIDDVINILYQIRRERDDENSLTRVYLIIKILGYKEKLVINSIRVGWRWITYRRESDLNSIYLDLLLDEFDDDIIIDYNTLQGNREDKINNILNENSL